MKNYKYLVPVVLVVLLLLSVYTLYSGRKAKEEEYQAYLAAARDYRAQGIEIDAEENYRAAYQMRPSVELGIEMAAMLEEFDMGRSTWRWAESVVSDFPLEVSGYEFLVEYYYKGLNYEDVFKTAKTYRGRRLHSDRIEAILQELQYAFYLSGGCDEVGAYSEGLCPYRVETRWGYMDETGKRVIDAAYAKVGCFSDSLAPVLTAEGEAYFIDPNGNKKHAVLGVEKVAELGFIADEVFPLYDGKTWAYYNYRNEKLFGDFDQASALANGAAAVERENRWSLVDASGSTLVGGCLGVVLDDKTIATRAGRAFVKEADGFHLVDLNGGKYGKTYADARLFNDGTYAAVRVGELWGFVDTEGNMVIEPRFEEARSFCNGLAAVCLGDKWGYINPQGELVIEPQFEDAREFTGSGTAPVRTERGWYILRLYSWEYDL